MKRNTRKVKHLRLSYFPWMIAIAMAFLPVIIGQILSVNIESCATDIKILEQKLTAAEQKLSRERAAWNKLCRPENLEAALIRYGLDLQYPKPEQIVYVKRNGLLNASVALQKSFRERQSKEAVAAVTPRKRTVRR